jgi:class 3 adenylate cyclase
MPLFMDRHSVPGATVEDAAANHARDLIVSAKHGVRFLSYWVDAANDGVFCLVDAPDPERLEAVHKEAHGLIPNEIISVSEDDVLRFLDRIHDPADSTEVTNPFRTILFTDLEGSTALTEEVGVSAFMVLLTEHDLIIRRALVAWRGREVKHTGDGILSSFDDVSNALECALAIQHGFQTRASEGGEPELRVRIGMAAGEPVDHNDDLYGSSVNLASRLCDTADPERILVSDVVRDLGSEQGFTFHDVNRLMLKGFSDPIAVFELLSSGG